MGTSTAGGDLHSERITKLQTRKKELEVLLAAKNDELYKLCVQEVKLTGVMPPEAPASPRERHRRRPDASASNRLSTPSSSDRFSHARSVPSVPSVAPPDTASLQRGRTTLPARRKAPEETRNLTRSRFTSSHPDFTTAHSMESQHPQQILGVPSAPSVPLIYQYASQVKARSRHLTGVPLPVPTNVPQISPGSTGVPAMSAAPVVVRRNALHRTQTYHLTSHSDYNGQPTSRRPPDVRSTSSRTTYQYSVSSSSMYNMSASQTSIQSRTSTRSDPPVDQRVKEKEWYESSLDSPPNPSPREHPKRPPAPPVSSGPPSPHVPVVEPPPETRSPPNPNANARSPQTSSDVPFESPKNCTVVESGKWIPYREVSKPFEMSDFYKYSTKFRQNTVNNNNNVTSPKTPTYCEPNMDNRPHMDSEQMYLQDYMRRSHQMQN